MNEPELPRLYVIADLDFAGGVREFRRGVDVVAEAARRHPFRLAIQIRAHSASAFELAALARSSRQAIGDEALLVLNGPDPLALELGFDGVHWPEAQIPDPRTQVHSLKLRTAAAHSVAAARRAHRAGATAAVFGPVFAPSWKQTQPVGLAALRECTAASPLPVYALGGIGPTDVSACAAAGAHGVAVLSGIAGSPGPAAKLQGSPDALK